MDRSTRIANILEQRKPLALKIEKIEDNLKAVWARLQSFDKHRNLLVTQVEQPKIIGRLKEIDFSQIQLNIASEIEALTKLKNRFSRDTINIGVIGRARQGKSRLLRGIANNVEEPVKKVIESSEKKRKHYPHRNTYHSRNLKPHHSQLRELANSAFST